MVGLGGSWLTASFSKYLGTYIHRYLPTYTPFESSIFHLFAFVWSGCSLGDYVVIPTWNETPQESGRNMIRGWRWMIWDDNALLGPPLLNRSEETGDVMLLVHILVTFWSPERGISRWYHHLVVHAHRSLTLAGRSRDDTLDFWLDGQTCQRMTVEKDNPQLSSHIPGNLIVWCCAA